MPISYVYNQDFIKGKIAIADNGCWHWAGYIRSDGYGSVGGYRNRWLAHSMSWLLFNGPIPDDICVLHKCDVRMCVNPKHLFLGTRGDNARDMVSKGRSPNTRYRAGERSGHAKFTDEQVRAMRQFVEIGDRTIASAARILGVSKELLWQMVRRKTYADVV